MIARDDLRHGAWYRLDGYPDLRAPFDFQFDLLYGRDIQIVLRHDVGPPWSPHWRTDVLPLALLLPYLTPIDRPEGREDTVDPDETTARLAERAVRERLGLPIRLAALDATLIEDEVPTEVTP